MNKLCAAVALGARWAARARRREQGSAATGPSLQRAEAAARGAVAPLVVERAVCIAQARRRVVCFLPTRMPARGSAARSSSCAARRVRVLQSNVCFEFRKVIP